MRPRSWCSSCQRSVISSARNCAFHSDTGFSSAVTFCGADAGGWGVARKTWRRRRRWREMTTPSTTSSRTSAAPAAARALDRLLNVIVSERAGYHGVRSPLQDLVSSNRVAKNGVDQHAPAVEREEDEYLPPDLAHFDDVLPPHPAPPLAEPPQHAVLVHHSDLTEKDVVAVLHDGGRERQEEEQNERGKRQNLELARPFGKVVEHQGRRRERRTAGNQPRHRRAVETEGAVHPRPVKHENECRGMSQGRGMRAEGRVGVCREAGGMRH